MSTHRRKRAGTALIAPRLPARTEDGSTPAPALVHDDDLDRLLPDDLRAHATTQFTPIDVARRAADMLVSRFGDAILDVGSGVGKFCLAAAAHRRDAVFIGAERHARLVSVATDLAAHFRIPNVSFVHANIVDLDWSHFDAFYFYNPFVDQFPEDAPDPARANERRPGPMGPSLLLHYARFVRQQLAEARRGTRVVTYHGLGAWPPSGYRRAGDERIGTDRLQLWIKHDL
jgi:SAM-dependent methyltransferase